MEDTSKLQFTVFGVVTSTSSARGRTLDTTAASRTPSQISVAESESTIQALEARVVCTPLPPYRVVRAKCNFCGLTGALRVACSVPPPCAGTSCRCCSIDRNFYFDKTSSSNNRATPTSLCIKLYDNLKV